MIHQISGKTVIKIWSVVFMWSC